MDTQRSQILEASIKIAKRHQQRTAWKALRNLFINVFVKCKEVNKRNELNIMVEDIDPHIIGITKYWATPDISDAELGMTGYVMFRKDRLGRRGAELFYI